ncbi:MAG: hypothetical protein F4Y41_10145 [Gammaproteobacteria bacterium]|nr:hypothetical protein [Gammaproteobacteria bacterium]MYF31512.1 hypothetical protein [Gammaproteobacteria bacterium]
MMLTTTPFRSGSLDSKNSMRLTLRSRVVVTVFAFCVVLVGTPGNAVEGRSWVEIITDWFDDEDVGATPRLLFRATENLIAEIRILREELGVDDFQAQAGTEEYRTPVHVYAKTLEVMSKVSRVQRRLGIDAVEVGHVPIKNVGPRDVLDNLAAILAELRKIKARWVIERSIDAAPFVGGITPSTPSMIYKNLAHASFLLDGLVGRPLAPNDVYVNARCLLDELALIAARLGAPFTLDVPSVEGRKSLEDVAQVVRRASYEMVNLQTRLGMDVSNVPNPTLVRSDPSEVYDATNMLLAEMGRIKHHLNIHATHPVRPEPHDKVPTDVFAQILLVIENLNTISRSANS